MITIMIVLISHNNDNDDLLNMLKALITLSIDASKFYAIMTVIIDIVKIMQQIHVKIMN